jgi:tRNA(Leu) C34 or U34 (ribose-2'-O)-methylase TrmL
MARGYAAVGLWQPKDPCNVGATIRAAHVYDAALVCIGGARGRSTYGSWVGHSTNTMKSDRHLPVICGDDLKAMIPHGAEPVAVDLVEGATPLPSFMHPRSAFYVFGPEDGTLGERVLSWCPHRVVVPTRRCMNLAACVNVVLYDRMVKMRTRKDEPIRAATREAA